MCICVYVDIPVYIYQPALCCCPILWSCRTHFLYCFCIHLDTLLFLKSDHVGFLLDLIRNTYLDHVILVGMVVVVVLVVVITIRGSLVYTMSIVVEFS